MKRTFGFDGFFTCGRAAFVRMKDAGRIRKRRNRATIFVDGMFRGRSWYSGNFVKNGDTKEAERVS